MKLVVTRGEVVICKPQASSTIVSWRGQITALQLKLGLNYDSGKAMKTDLPTCADLPSNLPIPK